MQIFQIYDLLNGKTPNHEGVFVARIGFSYIMSPMLCDEKDFISLKKRIMASVYYKKNSYHKVSIKKAKNILLKNLSFIREDEIFEISRTGIKKHSFIRLPE